MLAAFVALDLARGTPLRIVHLEHCVGNQRVPVRRLPDTAAVQRELIGIYRYAAPAGKRLDLLPFVERPRKVLIGRQQAPECEKVLRLDVDTDVFHVAAVYRATPQFGCGFDSCRGQHAKVMDGSIKRAGFFQISAVDSILVEHSGLGPRPTPTAQDQIGTSIALPEVFTRGLAMADDLKRSGRQDDQRGSTK
jgi:hypothetical protein